MKEGDIVKCEGCEGLFQIDYFQHLSRDVAWLSGSSAEDGEYVSVSRLSVPTAEEIFVVAGHPLPKTECWDAELMYDGGWWLIDTYYKSIWVFSDKNNCWTKLNINWPDHFTKGPDLRKLSIMSAIHYMPNTIRDWLDNNITK